MDEIDKAIDELRKAYDCLRYEAVPEYITNAVIARANTVINQLKECRGGMENMDLQHFQEIQLIEQRTREVCFEAAWEYVRKNFLITSTEFGGHHEVDLKQAIDEAKE